MELVRVPTTTQEQRVDWERHQAIHEAVDMIHMGFPDVALTRLIASVHKQARWSNSDDYTARGVTTWPHPQAALQAVS